MKRIDLSGRPVHFIGIGGIGMSGLAYVLAQLEIPVSGSDVNLSQITERLQSVGAQIFLGQDPSNLEFFQKNGRLTPLSALTREGERGEIEEKWRNPEKISKNLPQIIRSTAISANNREYQAAVEWGCPIFHRSDLLAALIEKYESIAVSGTHGKTTTSSLISYILFRAGLDPTIIVGGEVNAWEGNARLGKGKYLVAEADESDGTLTKHAPKIGVVTNIELDHPDHYQNLEEVIEIFKVFTAQCETWVGCVDCSNVKKYLKPKISYSINPELGADYTVKNINQTPSLTTAEVWERGYLLGQIQLKIPGKHNISNALAAVAVARLLGLEFEDIASGIASFEGAKRRFEVRGQCNEITIIDDYAHHPSEIIATLAAAKIKASKEENRIVAIFQPHRYSRTQKFIREFSTCFQDADQVIVTDIYGAGEKMEGKISGQSVAEAIASHHNHVLYYPALNSLSGLLFNILQKGDLVLFLGAGNLNQVIPELIGLYEQKNK